MPLRLHGVALVPITDTQIMMFGGRSEGSKYNMKFFTFDFERNKYTLHEERHRGGVCSTSLALVTQDAYYLYSSECELLKWCVHNHDLFRILKNSTVSFT
jgi:hypothetical protein